ncbi:hypothetical protein V2G26_003742 [Clonostachys chloroleuca]
MPPKKIEAVKDNVVAFGRVRKNLKMGCVGLPNVGKSSLFNLLTEQSAAAENYPFCTIEPNEARCAVPDERYRVLELSVRPLETAVHVPGLPASHRYRRSHSGCLSGRGTWKCLLVSHPGR